MDSVTGAIFKKFSSMDRAVVKRTVLQKARLTDLKDVIAQKRVY